VCSFHTCEKSVPELKMTIKVIQKDKNTFMYFTYPRRLKVHKSIFSALYSML